LYTGDFRDVKSAGDYWDFVVRSEVAKSEVATLLEKADMPPGLYQRGWNGRDASGRLVSNGIYFYRLAAGNVIRTMKMIVIR